MLTERCRCARKDNGWMNRRVSVRSNETFMVVIYKNFRSSQIRFVEHSFLFFCAALLSCRFSWHERHLCYPIRHLAPLWNEKRNWCSRAVEDMHGYREGALLPWQLIHFQTGFLRLCYTHGARFCVRFSSNCNASWVHRIPLLLLVNFKRVGSCLRYMRSANWTGAVVG